MTGRKAGPRFVRLLFGTHVGGARAARTGLDVEGNLLAAGQPIEVERRVEAVAMEEVVLPVVGGDEAKASVRDQLLDGACGHVWENSHAWLTRASDVVR